MAREEKERGKRRDERWETLKRGVQLLARLEGATVLLADGVHVVGITRVREPEKIASFLRDRATLDRSTLEANATMTRPPLLVTSAVLATAHRDLRALSMPPARALARERRKALVRFRDEETDSDVGEEAWIDAKRRRIGVLADVLARAAPREPSAWFDGILELVRAVHGDASAARIDEARARLTALGAERRRRAEGRIQAVVAALGGADPAALGDRELATLVERLDRARDMPGRARRTRVLDVLRKAALWPDAPAEAVRVVTEPLGGRSFEEVVHEAGRSLVRAMPRGRDPEARKRILDVLAFYGLTFRAGDDGVPLLGEHDVEKLLAARGEANDLDRSGVTLAQALALLEMKIERRVRARLARFVGEGLEVDLCAQAAEAGHAAALGRAKDLRAARAFATWATKLVPHYKALGVDLPLGPELFANLPRHEDLAVLGLCLMEHAKNEATPADPVAVLDATLGLFQKLPAKAGGLLGRLRGTDAGGGRRAFPEFADWLDDDALLDRYVHLTRLSGATVALTKRLREDFEHAAKASREREHLEGLAARHARQEARLATLRRAERTLAGAPIARTRRRIAERIERLLPVAYRRELDAAFREILRDAWGITVPALTQAWRDAVRFWLVVDDNRDLLGRLLRAAAATPGLDVKLGFEKNRAWVEKARARFAVDAWLAPRSEDVVLEGTAYTIALEEDPLEVLRMGIPFATCLALDEGCNAASTVSNALDANKRVLYVRGRDGKIVARKLLAISKDFRLLGYNLYVAVHGATETAIRDAVQRTCRAILDETGLETTINGEPESVLGGFWYDDGAVAFETDVDVDTYCRALELTPTPKWFDALAVEARAHAAMREDDVEAALRHVTRWDRGPANVALGDYAVARLGERDAERRAREEPALVAPIFRGMAKAGEEGMVRALAAATRLPEWPAAQALTPLLARFPRSTRIARGIAELANRAARAFPRTSDHGLVHLTVDELASMLDGVAESFDVLDAVAPAWEHLVSIAPSCRGCIAGAAERASAAILRAFERAVDPDADVVASCLMSRHRSAAAQRAGLRIAARHVLAGGTRALARLTTLRPDLARSPDMFAATIRQHGIDRITEVASRLLPETERPPFEALGPLVFEVDDLDRALGRWPTVTLDDWRPGPWELAFYRRHPKRELRAALVERTLAARTWETPRTMELLALLGDVDAFERIAAQPEDWTKYDGEKRPAQSTLFKYVSDARDAAKSVARQVASADAGRVCSPGTTVVVDRRLVELAIEVLRAPPQSTRSSTRVLDERDLAVEILATTNAPIDFDAIVAGLAASGDDEALARILAVKPTDGATLSPQTVVGVWQREPARAALTGALSRGSVDAWSSTAWACERAAEAAGESADGLLEAWALALLEKGSSSAADMESADQLRSVIRAAVSGAPPAQAVALYEQLPDELSASWFVRAVRRAPRDRAAGIREAVAKMRGGGSRAARKAWLEATRTRTRTSESGQSSERRPISTRGGARAIDMA